MVAVAITRPDLTAAELRGAVRYRDAQAARRMLALVLVLETVDRATAAKTCGLDRQTLRDWVHRHNADAPAGLVNRRAPARPSRRDRTQRGTGRSRHPGLRRCRLAQQQGPGRARKHLASAPCRPTARK